MGCQSVQLNLFDFRRPRVSKKAEYRPEYVAKLEEHLKTGSLFSFPARLNVKGVNDTTLYAWMKKHPEFRRVYMDHKAAKKAG